MENQQKIDELMKSLENNAQLSEQNSAELFRVIAAIEGAEELALVRTTLRTFRDMWQPNHPDVAAFWSYLLNMFQYDGTRRALMEGIEIGQLEKIGELPCPIIETGT